MKVRLRKSHQKDSPLFPVNEKILRCFHFKKRFAVISSERKDPSLFPLKIKIAVRTVQKCRFWDQNRPQHSKNVWVGSKHHECLGVIVIGSVPGFPHLRDWNYVKLGECSLCTKSILESGELATGSVEFSSSKVLRSTVGVLPSPRRWRKNGGITSWNDI